MVAQPNHILLFPQGFIVLACYRENGKSKKWSQVSPRSLSYRGCDQAQFQGALDIRIRSCPPLDVCWTVVLSIILVSWKSCRPTTLVRETQRACQQTSRIPRRPVRASPRPLPYLLVECLTKRLRTTPTIMRLGLPSTMRWRRKSLS